MKKLISLIIAIQLICVLQIKAQLIFNENFNTSSTPLGWTEEYVKGTVDWQFQKGGHNGNPENAYQGNYNAYFFYESTNNESTRLISPVINLDNKIKPELTFWHAQEIWFWNTDNWDQLKVYYKKGLDSTWVLLKYYSQPTDGWVQRTILIPDSARSQTFYLGFEGITGYGHGVCIDSIKLEETGIEPRRLVENTYHTATTDFISTNSTNNPILRMDFKIFGNSGEARLDSMRIKSLNTSDTIISDNGVKLFYTTDSIFTPNNQIGTGENFSSGYVTFKNLNKVLPTGYNYIWLTYDIKKDTAHTMHGDILDAMVEKESVLINDTLYPVADQSPEGNRSIFESIFTDDFETNKSWVLTGEFERNKPMGLGGSSGGADPASAYQGDTVLGSDLTGLGEYPGDYEHNISNRQDQAISPTINCYYYKNITLTFKRWLNIELWDRAYIDVSYDNGNTWKQAWKNPSYITDDDWNNFSLNISNFANRKSQVKIRFCVGPTNGLNQYSGWNIDNLAIVGDYITNDVGVTQQFTLFDGCGHTNSETITVKVKNFGAEASKDTIPIGYSTDNGETYTMDTIFGSIPIGDSTNFTFADKADLSVPNIYKIKIKTFLQNDEYTSNDCLSFTLKAIPTYSLPYYTDFENDSDFWSSNGINSSWEYGTPNASIISGAASGNYAWVTNTSGNHNSNESSYVISPCFNFSGIDYPVFEFNIFYDSKTDTVGAALQYSIDDGSSWNDIDTNQYYWNWYTDTVNYLDTSFQTYRGWSGNSGTWLNAKTILPKETANQSNIKFRVIFASDTTSDNNEGFAFDDVKIFEAPPDVGVDSLMTPDSACELSNAENVSIKIVNYGIDTLNTGYKIPVGLDFNNKPTIIDTLTLSANLLPKDTVDFTFTQTVDMSHAGNYPFVVYTLLKSDSDFYHPETNNDTLITHVSVYGMPNYDLGPAIGTEQPDTVVIDAGAGYDTYEWQDASSNQTFSVNAYGWYYVTVTNQYSCTANDSIEVLTSATDIGVDSLIAPVSTCELSDSEYVSIEILNSRDTIHYPDTLFLGLKFNQQSEISDTLVLNTDFLPDSTLNFTFSKPVDMSELDTTYNFTIYTKYYGDINTHNDTLYKSVETYGYPTVQFTADTIFSSQADTLVLDAGSGFLTYKWQDASSNQTFNVTDSASASYYVSVTDVHSCPANDSVKIISQDIGVTNLLTPTSSCELSDSEIVKIQFKNFGHDTLPKNYILPIYYSVNGSEPDTENFVFSSQLAPDSLFTFTFNKTVDMSNFGAYNFKIYTKPLFDANNNNDTLSPIVQSYGYPSINFNPDTILSSQADTIVLDAGAGYDTYLWQDASTNRTFNVIDSASATYYVTVTDIHTCEANDSIKIISQDLGITDMITPISNCALTDSEIVTVQIKNFGHDTLPIGYKLPIFYKENYLPPVDEEVIFSKKLAPDSSLTYTFNQPVNMSNSGYPYTLKVHLEPNYDANSNNNNIQKIIKNFGPFPTINLAYDTIFTTQADTVVLDAGAGFDTYQWQDKDSINQTYHVGKLSSSKYYVTVTNSNGCPANDSTTIIATDIGVSQLISPVNSCVLSHSENVNVLITNYSADTLNVNDTVFAELKFNNNFIETDTILLENIILPDSSFAHTFNNYFDLTNVDTYKFEAYTINKLDVNNANDTLVSNISVYGYPTFNLKYDTIASSRPDTIILDAGTGFAAYLWQDGSTNQTIHVKPKSSKWYSVTVTDTNGCDASDSTYISYFRKFDLGITNFISPVSACELTNNEKLTVNISNFGPDTLYSGDVIKLGYKINDIQMNKEDLTLSATFLPSRTLTYTFANTVDMSTSGTYLFKVYNYHRYNINSGNDTLSYIVYAYGYPNIDLGEDSISTSQPDTIILDAGAGYTSYLWQDGSTNQTLHVSSAESAWYKVSVTNEHGCSSSDSIYIDSHVGINNINNKFLINIYPNPAKNVLNIEFNSDKKQNVIIELINITGKTVVKKSIKNIVNYKSSIDVSNFNKGFYYLKIYNKEILKIKPVVIQ